MEWRKDISPFEKSQIGRSTWQIINTIVPFFALWYIAYLTLSVSFWLSLMPSILAAGFLVRTFIIFHDCCHRSFFKSKLANEILGNITGVMTLCPYMQWKYSHSVHHTTNGNLDKRGTGDIWVMTVEEYLAAPMKTKIAYRIYRNPITLFGIGPVYIFLIDYRFNRKDAKMNEKLNTYLTNFAIIGAIVAMTLLIGWQAFLLIQVPIFLVSSIAGVWMFYVQHQFEEGYFEEDESWDYVQAAIKGSSFYKLPAFISWMTGDIGYHHVHHLSPRVPNYHLQKAHEKNELLQKAYTITFWESIKTIRFRMWDEEEKKFIGFRELKQYIKKNKSL